MLRDSSENEVEFHVRYEAGCRGYSHAKDLLAKGIDWVIMATTTIDKPSDYSKKTDRFDTRLLARAFMNTSYKLFYIRIEQDLMTKEKIRML